MVRVERVRLYADLGEDLRFDALPPLPPGSFAEARVGRDGQGAEELRCDCAPGEHADVGGGHPV
jgi:hypothetical protein